MARREGGLTGLRQILVRSAHFGNVTVAPGTKGVAPIGIIHTLYDDKGRGRQGPLWRLGQDFMKL